MNGLNNSTDDAVECPLCLEALDVDDLNFFPCTCGYQICRFCWHRIRTDENELCPACRKAYSENPADFTPLSQEQISALKAEKRQRDQQRKQKITENRKHLANVRVVQKNLVFVVGLPPRLADPDILKKHEYFGKYGKIHKVVINPSTTYAGVQGPSASAYVTYCSNSDALRAIQSVNNIMIDSRPLKTSLGTTKYCSHFMKNQNCPKPDCMYLHDLGDPEASFTKEEMHQGKHQEYEKRLHDALIAQTQLANNSSSTADMKLDENSKLTGDMQNGELDVKDAWPCLSESPKDGKLNGKIMGKENGKKTKGEKHKSKKSLAHHKEHNSVGFHSEGEMNTSGSDTTDNQKQSISDEELCNVMSEIENSDLLEQMTRKSDTPSMSSTSGDSGTVSESASGKSSPGAFPDYSIQNEAPTSSATSTLSSVDDSSTKQLSIDINNSSSKTINSHSIMNGDVSGGQGTTIGGGQQQQQFSPQPPANHISLLDATDRFSKLGLFDDNNSFFSSNTFQPYFKIDSKLSDTVPASDSESTTILPDLLNGTESDKERLEHDKLNLLKELDDSPFQNFSNTGLLCDTNGTEDWEELRFLAAKSKQMEDLNNLHVLQKRNNLMNGFGPSHLNGFQNNETNAGMDYFHNTNDPYRYSQFLHHQPSQQHGQQQHTRLHNGTGLHADNLNGQIYTGNMSKFFDFHKNQQQQQSQHNQQPQFMYNGHSDPLTDQMNMANILENNRINSQYLEHTNGTQLHKQRLINKFDQPNPLQQQHSLNMLHNQSSSNRQTNRLQNNRYSQNTSADDDLGFDPFFETQKGLAELLENEMVQQQSQTNHSKILENCQRARMPPPGFNHMNAFGLGVPRAQSSKILPFMNMSNAQAQHQNWNQSPQQQPPMAGGGYQQQRLYDQQNHLSQPNQQNNKSGYGNLTDWTALDPAIVSFRQFPAFMSGPMQQQQQQQQQPPHNSDMFMSHMNQHQSQQHIQPGGQGFGQHGLNLQNSIMNPQQQSSPAQVNFSHSNWLNSDQSSNMFLNSLSNGFASNYEKFSIPLPPGFPNHGKQQQKTECIN